MLDSPYEIFELTDEETRAFAVLSYEAGEAIIRPARAPGGVAVAVLRVHVRAADKAYFPFYWDITSKTLIAQLKPLLDGGNYQAREFRVTKHGTGPSARFSLKVI